MHYSIQRLQEFLRFHIFCLSISERNSSSQGICLSVIWSHSVHILDFLSGRCSHSASYLILWNEEMHLTAELRNYYQLLLKLKTYQVQLIKDQKAIYISI